MARLYLCGEEAADALLSRDALALMTGMVLDQQVPMERAFVAPYRLAQRLGTTDRLDPALLAGYDPEALAELFAQSPSLHRYPQTMANRVQGLCRTVVDTYGGDPEAVWRDVSSGHELVRRLRTLPGFGERKARIFVAFLGKQLGVAPSGWREAAGEYGAATGYESVADVTDADSMARLRETKQQHKQARRQG